MILHTTHKQQTIMGLQKKKKKKKTVIIMVLFLHFETTISIVASICQKLCQFVGIRHFCDICHVIVRPSLLATPTISFKPIFV